MPRGPYNAAHEREGRRQRAELPADGSALCPRCRRSMFPSAAAAIAAGAPASMGKTDLDDFPGLVFGGKQVKLLSHARCNRIAGAVVGNKLRGMRKAAGLPTSRRQAARPRW